MDFQTLVGINLPLIAPVFKPIMLTFVITK